MKLKETKLNGVFILELEPAVDARGFYKRLWGEEDFAALGLDPRLNNIGLSYNKSSGTLRGMHYQEDPFAEAKLVQCLRGKIYDVILDIRRDSETFCQWVPVELSPDKHSAVYIPKGCAHGFQTLEDDSEVLYFISEKHNPEAAKGIRWNDPGFDLKFPLGVSVINERDASYPDFVL